MEITSANLKLVCALSTHHSQERFVSPVVKSLAEAFIPPLEQGVPHVPWVRAIEADGELVGFIMLADVMQANPYPYLWRLLIDRNHQRRGIARRAIDLLAADRRTKGDSQLLVSYKPGVGSPEPFYLRCGFVSTGTMNDDEIEMALAL